MRVEKCTPAPPSDSVLTRWPAGARDRWEPTRDCPVCSCALKRCAKTSHASADGTAGHGGMVVWCARLSFHLFVFNPPWRSGWHLRTSRVCTEGAKASAPWSRQLALENLSSAYRGWRQKTDISAFNTTLALLIQQRRAYRRGARRSRRWLRAAMLARMSCRTPCRPPCSLPLPSADGKAACALVGRATRARLTALGETPSPS